MNLLSLLSYWKRNGISDIQFSSEPPKDPTVLWFDTKEKTLKYYEHGTWKPIKQEFIVYSDTEPKDTTVIWYNTTKQCFCIYSPKDHKWKMLQLQSMGHTTFDNNINGTWKYYISIELDTVPKEDIQYRIEFTSKCTNVWSNDLKRILVTGPIGNFWQQVHEYDLRVFDEYNQQNYFWIEKFSREQKHAIIWVKLHVGQRQINIAYGNKDCNESVYHDAHKVFTRTIDGLVGCWCFNEGQGNTVYDSSGYDNRGTIHGATWTDDGYYGKALYFDGNDYIRIPNSKSLQVDRDLTVLVRFFPKDVKRGRQGLVFKHYNNEYEVIMEPTGNVSFYHGDGYWEEIQEPPHSVIQNQWNFVAITRTITNRTIKFYLNGQYKGSDKFTKMPRKSNYDVYIGTRAYRWYYFYGLIDEVMIFNKALSDTEINDLYQYHGIGGYDGKCYVRKVIDKNLRFRKISIKEF